MIIDERRIRILREAFTAGSMRAAAERLDIAPSSVSRQIALLEAEIGSDLIEHGRRDIRLTEAGRRVIEYFHEIEARRLRLVEDLSDLAGNLTGQVRIAVGEGFLGAALNEAIDVFRSRYPNVALSVRVTDTLEIMRLVADDELHFGLVFHPQDDLKLVSRFSMRVPLRLVLAPDHLLAGAEALSLHQIADQPLALTESRYRIRQVIDQAAHEARVGLRCTIETNSIALLLQAARSGQAMTILPAFSAAADVASGRLAIVPLSDPALQPLYVHVVTRAKRHFSGPASFLVDHLKGQIAAIMS